MYLCEGIGDLLHAVLQGLFKHAFDEGVEFCLYRHFHLRVVLVDGQHLDPYVEGYRRLHRFEFHTLRLLTITDTQFQFSHRVHIEADGILVVFEIIDFVLRHAILYFFQIAQVADVPIDSLLRVGNLFYATLELAFTSE